MAGADTPPDITPDVPDPEPDTTPEEPDNTPEEPELDSAPIASPAPKTPQKAVLLFPTRRPAKGAPKQICWKIHWLRSKLSWTHCAYRPS